MGADPRSIRAFGQLVANWWHEPVDYRAYVEYFRKRSIAGAIQLLVGSGTGLMAVVALAVLHPTVENASPESWIVVVLFSCLLAGWAVVWCGRPWPTLRQSRAFIITADLGISSLAMMGSNWLMPLFALNCFALISVYLMFFDGPRALALHIAAIMLTTVAFVATADPEQGLSPGAVLGAVSPLITAPLGVQLGIHTLRNDANESATDPLTGLLNRRGLYLHLGDLLGRRTAHTTDVVAVVLVDLDRFKEVNDTYGHARGDDVLIRCARQISSAAGGSALVARLGGEEFVIVDLDAPQTAAETAEHVRLAIMAPSEPPTITASVGVTTAPHSDFRAAGADARKIIDKVIARADHAMLVAKRGGGNRTHHL